MWHTDDRLEVLELVKTYWPFCLEARLLLSSYCKLPSPPAYYHSTPFLFSSLPGLHCKGTSHYSQKMGVGKLAFSPWVRAVFFDYHFKVLNPSLKSRFLHFVILEFQLTRSQGKIKNFQLNAWTQYVHAENNLSHLGYFWIFY